MSSTASETAPSQAVAAGAGAFADSAAGSTPAVGSVADYRAAVTKRRLEDPLYYGEYLQLPAVLNAQHPKSAEAGHPSSHELLFIITHQTYELWFKQILFELDIVRSTLSTVPVEEKCIGEAVRRLVRIREIQNVMLQQISVLETMSPLDFLEFRDFLYPASGFQSVQFRLVENKLGLPASARLSYGLRGYCTYLNEEDASTVKAAEGEPSVLQLVERWLERTPALDWVTEGDAPAPAGAAAGSSSDAAGSSSDAADSAGSAASGAADSGSGTSSFWAHYRAAVTAMLDEDERAIRANSGGPAGSGALAPELVLQQVAELSKQREHFNALFSEAKYGELLKRGDKRLSYRAMQAALLITLYHDEPLLTLPHRLLMALVDIDEQFALWRHRHALMVARMLGAKVGTGGSSGFHYLRATAERHRVFTDLTDLPTYLIPRAMLPPLPEKVARSLSFSFSSLAGKGASSSSSSAAAGGAGSTSSSASASPAKPAAPSVSAAVAATSTPAAPHPVPQGASMADAAAAGCPFARRQAAAAAASAASSATAAAVAAPSPKGDVGPAGGAVIGGTATAGDLVTDARAAPASTP